MSEPTIIMQASEVYDLVWAAIVRIEAERDQWNKEVVAKKMLERTCFLRPRFKTEAEAIAALKGWDYPCRHGGQIIGELRKLASFAAAGIRRGDCSVPVTAVQCVWLGFT